VKIIILKSPEFGVQVAEKTCWGMATTMKYGFETKGKGR
jgi:hypothetical protein